MNTDDARNLYGVDGSGVTVGTLSDSYNCYPEHSDRDRTASDDIASGDLTSPNSYRMHSCTPDPRDWQSMRARHDATYPGPRPRRDAPVPHRQRRRSGFANGIQTLANQGSDIIVDDIVYFGEAFFQDDIVAQAAQSVGSNGVPYFLRSREQRHTILCLRPSGTAGKPFTPSTQCTCARWENGKRDKYQ